MNVNNIHWMNYSIAISNEIPQSNLRAGAVLVSENNSLVCSAFSGEEDSMSWSSVLLNKTRKRKKTYVQSAYITINTLSATSLFHLLELLNEITISEIYIGLPDPELTHYLDGDPVIMFERIHRFPDELQCKILKQNHSFFSSCKQSLENSPYYAENRISDLVINKLMSQGFIVSKEELNANKSRTALAFLISNRYEIEYSKAICIVCDAISDAYDTKYGAYSYLNDTRSLNIDWEKRFTAFYQKSSTVPMAAMNILNVGVGSGHEAVSLFSNCTHVTFVDIAQNGLEKIKKKIPLSKTVTSSADNLSSISSNYYDLYVSLRTYNSSFFETKRAISEARRVLRHKALIIISIANGFLCPEKRCIIPGLIIPGTEFIDIYRGMDTIKRLHGELKQEGFEKIQVLPTNTEIFLSAVNSK